MKEKGIGDLLVSDDLGSSSFNGVAHSHTMMYWEIRGGEKAKTHQRAVGCEMRGLWAHGSLPFTMGTIRACVRMEWPISEKEEHDTGKRRKKRLWEDRLQRLRRISFNRKKDTNTE